MPLDESFKAALMLDQWDHLSLVECEEIARNLDQVLPASFRFHTLKTCLFSDQKHHIAVFEWGGVPEDNNRGFFALIPGGKPTLGYDRDYPFIPNNHQKASWEQETMQTQMFTGSLDTFLDQVMTPFRRVSIEPFLLEILATSLAPPFVFDETAGSSGGWTRTAKFISYERTLQRISKEGFRFPTSDEWEYACSAGSRTLFRWGNDSPSFSIPHLGNHKVTGWNLHLQQNSFGLLIARNPYHWEFSSESGFMRGGDGGTALHAGAGTFAEWLTLASAFYCLWDRPDYYGAHLRRAFSLF